MKNSSGALRLSKIDAAPELESPPLDWTFSLQLSHFQLWTPPRTRARTWSAAAIRCASRRATRGPCASTAGNWSKSRWRSRWKQRDGQWEDGQWCQATSVRKLSICYYYWLNLAPGTRLRERHESRKMQFIATTPVLCCAVTSLIYGCRSVLNWTWTVVEQLKSTSASHWHKDLTFLRKISIHDRQMMVKTIKQCGFCRC